MTRSQFEMVLDLLMAIHEHPNYSLVRITACCNMNYMVAKNWVILLNHNGYLTLHSERPRKYAVTIKGLEILKVMPKIQEFQKMVIIEKEKMK
jgi:predicted transcriptional regulator